VSGSTLFFLCNSKEQFSFSFSSFFFFFSSFFFLFVFFFLICETTTTTTTTNRDCDSMLRAGRSLKSSMVALTICGRSGRLLIASVCGRLFRLGVLCAILRGKPPSSRRQRDIVNT
jgi:hypothetical protein